VIKSFGRPAPVEKSSAAPATEAGGDKAPSRDEKAAKKAEKTPKKEEKRAKSDDKTSQKPDGAQR
jgi:hypothetical protein